MKIKDIKVGNYVLSRNPNGKLEYKKVVSTFDNGEQTVYEFTLKSGNKIVSTFDHKVLTEFDTFEPIGAVKNIKTIDGLDEIIECKQLNNQKVYDIEVQDNHNFFVKGCVVANCRAGAQTPFSSINYGTGTSEECRMIIKSVMKATDAGLGHGETAIFPVQIFRLHKGVNMEKGDPNYDLFQYACKVSAKRLFPNFEYLDVPFNLQYYKEGHPETEIAVMGALAEGYVDLKVYDENGDLKEILNQYKIQDVKDYLLSHSELIDGDPKFIDFDETTKYVNIKPNRLKIADSQTGIEEYINVKKYMYWNDSDAKWLKVSYTYHTNKWMGLTGNVIVTDDHPLRTRSCQTDKWKRVLTRDIKIGDEIKISDDKCYSSKITSIEEIQTDNIITGYDFETESDCFNVNDIVSHNCRTRVIGNSAKPENEVYPGRGNFSFTTINLPRLGIEAKGDWDKFYKDFDRMIDLAKDQLLDRFERISHKHVYNYPFLMQQGVWIDSDDLSLNDEIGEVLKNSSISIGFIGLAECLKAMMDKHHGESEEALKKGLEIIQHLRDKTDAFTKEYHLNFSTFASPAEGLCLSGDTVVQTMHENKCIKDVKLGDYVLTMNEQTHEIEYRLVLKSQKTFEQASVMKLTFENDKTITCTHNHPIMRSDYSWARADELKVNDEVLGINPHNLMIRTSKLIKIEYLEEQIAVYDITVDQNHNFFLGNGILVHNSGRFTRLDKKKYGELEGITDREYYTNSFHIPVYFNIPAYKKMQIEGKFHELCNAGAITYVEANGDLTKNVKAFEDIVKYAGECGISYFSINHAVDRCPVCGYTGIIGDECPRCGFREGVGVSLEQLKKRGINLSCLG